VTVPGEHRRMHAYSSCLPGEDPLAADRVGSGAVCARNWAIRVN